MPRIVAQFLYLLLIFTAGWVMYWAIGMTALPGPFHMIASIAVLVIVFLAVLNLLFGWYPYPGLEKGPTP